MNNKKRNKTQKKIDYLYQVAMNNQTTRYERRYR